MKKEEVAILYNDPEQSTEGSRPDEREVLEEVEAVEEALLSSGHPVCRIPFWDDVEGLVKALRERRPACMVNLCEAFRGESLPQMNIPALLEMLGIPYTGSGPLAIGISQDKGLTKALLAHSGVPVPRFFVMDRPSPIPFSFPCIVKPLYEDASLGIGFDSVVMDERALDKKVSEIISRFKEPAIVEEFIEGREVNAALFGNDPPEVLPLSEIDFSEFPHDLPKILFYDAKWDEENSLFQKSPPVCPARIEGPLLERIREIALRAYRTTGCRDYGRVDFRIRDGIPYVLEVNTNPDISPKAGFARSLSAASIPYRDFVLRLLNLALARRKNG